MIAFIAFAGLLSYMAYRCMKMPVNLVTAEYYKDELTYQDVIDATKNANALSGKATLVQNASNVLLQLPGEMREKQLTGSVFFYCASNIANDRKVALSTDGQAKQEINIKQFSKGLYTVKIEWSDHDKHYYAEEPFVISSVN